MSFGFSIGDFIAAINLANKIRKEFVDAPAQFKAIADEIRSLSIVLQDADVAFPRQELNADQQRDLEDVDKSCRNVLDDIHRILDKNSELSSEGGSAGKKAKRVWKRLTWKPEDINELRSRINTNVGFLNAFSGRSTRANVIKLVQHQEDKDRQLVLDWITPIDYTAQQNDILRDRQEGTGQWLLDSPQFKLWLETDEQTLFCPGIPGAGKTILTSIVVDELITHFGDEKSVGIAYLYCNFRRHDEQKIDDLLASLLRQLAEGQSPLPGSVIDLHNLHKAKRTRPSINEISSSLQLVITMHSKVFFVIDGLDECQVSNGHQTRLLSELFSLQAKCGVKLFATSRFVPEITKKFHGSTFLEIRANEADMRSYLDSHISHLPSFVQSNPVLQDEIITEIVKAVDGMFLLARLNLYSLEGKRSPTAVRKALRKLSSGSDAYDSAYKDAMVRIEGQVTDQVKLAKQVLAWITCAKRPLTTSELRYALAMEKEDDSVLDEDKLSQLDEQNLSQLEDMITVCAGLVTVDKESDIIRLVHYTTQQYFNRTQGHWFPTAEADITTICVTYLSFTVFEGGVCQTDDEFEEQSRSNQFFEYAARNWGHHAHLASTSTRVDKLVLKFLENEVKVAGATQAMVILDKCSGYSQKAPKGAKGLHLAAHFSLEITAAELLKRGHDPEVTDSDGQTPLMWAVDNGHETLVKVLLSTELAINSSDKLKRTALHHAASIGQVKSMRMLIQHGADVEARDMKGQTPFLAAVFQGQKMAVEVLLNAGTDKIVFDNERKGALHLSIESEYFGVEIVEMLLAHGLPVDVTDINNLTPLHCTIPYNRKDIASLLLLSGVAIDTRVQRKSWTWRLQDGSNVYEPNHADTSTHEHYTSDLGGLTSLHFAALVGDAEGTEFFLSQGADPNALSNHEETPLHLALSKNIQGSKYKDAWNEDRWRLEDLWDAVDLDDEGVPEAVGTHIINTRNAVIEMLLNDGRTNVTLQDAQHASLLHRVNYRKLGSSHIVRRLVQKGAKVNAPNLKGQTALHVASLAGHFESVEILLNEGATIAAVDDEGKAAIHYAAKSGNTQTVMCILGAFDGEDLGHLTLKDKNGRTALHYSVGGAYSTKFDMVRKLLSLGASADIMDDFGNTPLAHYFSQRRFSTNLEICKLLLDHGTSAKSVNKAGETLAELYVKYGKVDVEVLQILKAYNVDMDRTNSKGMTLLHTIALRGSLTEKALTFLLGNFDIQRDRTDVSGKTALQYATEEAERKRHPHIYDANRWSRTADILRMYAI